MVVRYKTDFYASYMLVEIPQEIDKQQYSFKMLERNKIQGALSCMQRIEDGKAYLYIDVSGKKTLLQEYKDKEMELEEMVHIFQQLLPVLEELKKYLLTEKMVLLQPEYIFRDLEDGSLCITILPWEHQEENGLHKLAEFFLEKMNHKDEYGVNAAYHFYKQQSQPYFSLYHFISVLEKESILKRQCKKDDSDSVTKMKYEKNYGEDFWREEEINEITEEKTFVQQEKKRKKEYVGILFIVFSVLLLSFSFMPVLKQRKKLFCLYLAVLFFLLGLMILLIQYIQKKNIGNKEEQQKEEKVTSHEMLILEAEKQETVFFESDLSGDFLKLQWKERGRNKQFVLKDLPVTFGKIKEEVSVAVEHPSVSRIHCRFVEKNGGVAIMDLNSTNGTYLNGIEVKEGEILEIVKNDEILIGKVKILVV